MSLRPTITAFFLVLLTTVSTIGIVFDLKCNMPHDDHHHTMANTTSTSMDMPGMSNDKMQDMPVASQTATHSELNVFSDCKAPCSVDYTWVGGKKSFGQELVAVTHAPVPVPFQVTTIVSGRFNSTLRLRVHRAPPILRI